MIILFAHFLPPFWILYQNGCVLIVGQYKPRKSICQIKNKIFLTDFFRRLEKTGKQVQITAETAAGHGG